MMAKLQKNCPEQIVEAALLASDRFNLRLKPLSGLILP
jgi:hypothetical protein